MQRVGRDDYPWWVKATIKETTSRRAAWFWFGLSALFVSALTLAFYILLKRQ